MTSVGHIPEIEDDYDDYISRMRETEYPMLHDAIYLDHAGTTLYSKSLMDRFHVEMMRSLFGNPHSASPSSQRSTIEIENVRLDMLKYVKADPEDFDLVFTSNATAAIKIVMEGFREQEGGFSFGYHVDSHTSLVGMREAAKQHRCLESDASIASWIDDENDGITARLFAYPAQSNMSGRRLLLDPIGKIRNEPIRENVYTLLDAAAFASTSPLDLSNVKTAPDFTVLSLNKLFGFPDLGALIIRKSSSSIFNRRQYFGGGTVDMVVCMKEHWHAFKSGALHERLEDGTLPVHSILALKSALVTHHELFGSAEKISRHTSRLARLLYAGLSSLRHRNGQHICAIYKHDESTYEDVATQGPTVAFNLRDSKGSWVSNHEVEKLAAIRNIHLRTGGMCNPGGTASVLHLAPWEMRENFSAGFRCGTEHDVVNGKPTGLIRISLGAMSTKSDVHQFLAFIDEFFVDRQAEPSSRPPSPLAVTNNGRRRFHVESLSVYPIKSCGGWQVPNDLPWTIHREGLAWDREWCIVHQGTGKALSQKQYPAMAVIRPSLDFKAGMLKIVAPGVVGQVIVPLSKDPNYFAGPAFTAREASVCGDAVNTRVYSSPLVADFFTKAIGVPCTLARFPTTNSPSIRHSKAHLTASTDAPRSILFSNESPILTISRSSLNRLNETIKAHGGKAARLSVFRANIVLAEDPLLPPGQERPWVEEEWGSMRIGGQDGAILEFLGGCRRCQMVCIDQRSGEKNQEPFVTLAKTRRFGGRVLFGVHTALARGASAMIKAGDIVETFTADETDI